MVMLTRGVWRATPPFFGSDLEEVTMPLAMRSGPPSFSLAKTKIASPLATRLPPYIVFCLLNAKVSAKTSVTLALIAKVICVRHLLTRGIQAKMQRPVLDQNSEGV